MLKNADDSLCSGSGVQLISSNGVVIRWVMLGKALVHTRARVHVSIDDSRLQNHSTYTTDKVTRSRDLFFLPENNAYSFGRTTIANLKSG